MEEFVDDILELRRADVVRQVDRRFEMLPLGAHELAKHAAMAAVLHLSLSLSIPCRRRRRRRRKRRGEDVFALVSSGLKESLKLRRPNKREAHTSPFQPNRREAQPRFQRERKRNETKNPS